MFYVKDSVNVINYQEKYKIDAWNFESTVRPIDMLYVEKHLYAYA